MPKSRKPWIPTRLYDTIEGIGFLLGVVPGSTAALRKPPTTLLEKAAYSAKINKRRRRLKEIRTGFKRFLAFLFSQIGLSIIVIGYTIIGGVIFRAVELEHEKQVKIQGKNLRTSLADQFSNAIIRELRYQITSLNTMQGKYYEPEPAKKDEPKGPSRVMRAETAKKIRLKRSRTGGEYARLKEWLRVIVYILRHKTRQELHSSLRKLVKMMEETGWNGEDSMDDCKWSWAGAILFAVTVITTIGYGHAVPKTNTGKLLTIIYALIGIPLVVLYLTNIGDYLASLFRILYAKICRRCCEGSCLGGIDSRQKMSSFNAFKARASDIDLTQRRDFLLDESLHRNNINIIRRIGPLAVRKEKKKISKKENLMMDCVGINVFCNEHVIEMDRLEQLEQRQTSENEVNEAPQTSSHRMCLTVSANPSRSFWLNNSDIKTEVTKEIPDSRRAGSLGSTHSPRIASSPEFTDKTDLCTTLSNTHSTVAIMNDSSDSAVQLKSLQSEKRPNSFESNVPRSKSISVHNAGIQTILQAGPNDILTYQSLCKSFITGHYLRSYRRELRHQKKHLQRKFKKSQSQEPNLKSENSCESTEPVADKDNRQSLSEKTPEGEPTDHEKMCLSLQDFKARASLRKQFRPSKSVSPILDTKSEHNLPRPRKKLIVSSPVNGIGQKSRILQAPSGKQKRSPGFYMNPHQESRLSVLSSLASSSNELTVRLSYYSDEKITEEGSISNQQLHGDDDFDGEDISKVTVPISLSIMIVTTYILIGAFVFCIWEDSNYLKWSYFCFVTLSTIGFGDIVPESKTRYPVFSTKIDSTNPKEKLIIITVYVAVGLSVFAMCFKLMQEEVVSKCKWLAHYIGVLKRKVRKYRVDQPQFLETTSLGEEHEDEDRAVSTTELSPS
ncbi:hypothetical protein Aperf_G00000034621 [Anoplocephala perfoliata]